MPEPSQTPAELTDEQVAVLKRCRFEQRQFVPYASLKSLEPVDEEGQWDQELPYHGQPFDSEKSRLAEGAWDHEHCWVCWAKIVEGDSYWPNTALDEGGQVDLCKTCYRQFLSRIRI